jgi:hypothetical protein
LKKCHGSETISKGGASAARFTFLGSPTYENHGRYLE